MSIIIDNYETITRTIIKNIRNGHIISNNSERLDSLNIKELFNLFVQEFDLNHYHSTISPLDITIDVDNTILKIHLPHKPIFISSIYFQGLGDVLIPDELNDNLINNDIYFDIVNATQAKDLIGTNSICRVSYVSYNRIMV